MKSTRLRLRVSLPPATSALVSGHGARGKIVQLSGLGPSQIERRLASAAAGKERRK